MKAQVASSLIRFEATAAGGRARFRFAAGLPVLAGHFPGAPIVPGVFLIEAVRLAAERRAGRPLRISEVREARFSAPVEPERDLDLEFSLVEGPACWSCRAEARLSDVAAGKFRLELVPRIGDSGASV